MDLRVYKKEEVKQPNGTAYVYVPNVIDIYPQTDDEDLILTGADILEDNDEIEQACSLATIWQRGLDPVELGDGNRWTELYLGEINIISIMEDITESVQSVTPSVNVDFNTAKDSNGNSYLTYTIKAVS